jgi:hypothetical protein
MCTSCTAYLHQHRSGQGTSGCLVSCKGINMLIPVQGGLTCALLASAICSVTPMASATSSSVWLPAVSCSAVVLPTADDLAGPIASAKKPLPHEVCGAIVAWTNPCIHDNVCCWHDAMCLCPALCLVVAHAHKGYIHRVIWTSCTPWSSPAGACRHRAARAACLARSMISSASWWRAARNTCTFPHLCTAIVIDGGHRSGRH